MKQLLGLHLLTSAQKSEMAAQLQDDPWRLTSSMCCWAPMPSKAGPHQKIQKIQSPYTKNHRPKSHQKVNGKVPKSHQKVTGQFPKSHQKSAQKSPKKCPKVTGKVPKSHRKSAQKSSKSHRKNAQMSSTKHGFAPVNFW